ncbi:MAG: magnesium transporter CorA family protein [Levilactobacillus sp.]|jgi:Mg2+ and Co2+ transporter CorA|uniref:Magnesium transporter CorA family protein n=1 Tax=Levilactobacillus suantsaiihabitans TaxID=2487722 RepID=A0A4Z0JEC7_9LACO|nr:MULTISPECIES: magnesium transporter CorA family protein [Levilactobacillus]MCI1553398.1 magnesium transporter CorA family protein [Levilactobacillus sp.]MCI1599067.1 magnesium transporter CorA family protein [Levilactobacillus sp.]MCI1606597.1 magnesium transporter CorA family protein [Levilactobacillus sp.]TGD19763.1 magnesium transporter CorA family protein [Levilactobacillus suantsaiihabitans]
MIVERKIGTGEQNLVWVMAMIEDDSDKDALQVTYGLTDEILTYVTDVNERSHYDRDEYLNTQLFVLHVPVVVDQVSQRYITRPVTFLLKGNQVFSITTKRTQWVNQTLSERMKLKQISDTNEFMLIGLFILFDQFIPPIRKINAEQNRLDKQLNQAPDNKDLIALSNLQQSLAYFVSATRNNAMMVVNLSSTPFGKQLSDKNSEHLADAVIEARQTSEMTAIEADVVDRISNTFNNVLNNNLNDTMKFLTIWSLVLTIPTIITGFYGMNVKLPFANDTISWLFTVVMMLGIMGVVALLLRHRHFW